MGEQADYLIDAILNDEDSEFFGRRPIGTPKCFRCGRLCLWMKRQRKWRLFENGVLHVCKSTGIQPEDFAVIAADRG